MPCRCGQNWANLGSEARRPGTSASTALVLADRAVVIRRQLEQAYPVTRKTRITYSGRGYTAGFAQGQRADIGNARLGRARELNRA